MTAHPNTGSPTANLALALSEALKADLCMDESIVALVKLADHIAAFEQARYEGDKCAMSDAAAYMSDAASDVFTLTDYEPTFDANVEHWLTVEDVL